MCLHSINSDYTCVNQKSKEHNVHNQIFPPNSVLTHEHEVLWAVFLTAELFMAYYEFFWLFCMSLVILEAAFQRHFPNMGENYTLFHLFFFFLFGMVEYLMHVQLGNMGLLFCWEVWGGLTLLFAHGVSKCCRHSTDEAWFLLCQSWGSLQILCCLTMVGNLWFPQQRSCMVAIRHHAICTDLMF